MKVLIIEDEDALLEEMVQYLRRHGHEVVVSNSIATAGDALKAMLESAAAPDAIVCDVGLPNGNGVDFYVMFAAAVPSCRWMLLSGAHDFDRLQSKLGGLVGFAPAIVEKPMALRALRQFVEGRPPRDSNGGASAI